MSAANGGGDAGAWLRISPDGLANLLDCPEDFTAIMLPLCRWYMGLRFERPKGLRGAVFDLMQAGQERNLATWQKVSDGGRKGGQAKSERKADAVRTNGCTGGRPRKTENQSPLGKNLSPLAENLSPLAKNLSNETKLNETKRNETERNETKLNKTERNETRRPQAATVSPPLSNCNDVFVSSATAHGASGDAAIAAAIEDAAQRLGDGVPSRDKWRRFMLAHGVAAFREIVEEVTDKAGIAKKGAYLNTRLDAYVPPAPPVHAAATAQKPRAFTRGDWILCEERCAHFNAERTACPYSRVPPEHAANPHPPDECPHFKRCADYDKLRQGKSFSFPG